MYCISQYVVYLPVVKKILSIYVSKSTRLLKLLIKFLPYDKLKLSLLQKLDLQKDARQLNMLGGMALCVHINFGISH